MTPARGGSPIWLKIAQALTTEIEVQALEPGARLPTEAQLAARFEVNRHTVRRALESLVRRGMVRVEQGRGAFVADDVLDYEVTSRTRFSEWIRRQNRLPEGRALRLRELAARGGVAEALQLDVGRPVVLLERLGLADGQPVTLTDHYFPLERLPGIADALRSEATISQALIAVGVLDYSRQSTRVAARMPTLAEGELLQMSRARPLLVCENVNVDPAGRIIEFGLARYPSTRVQVVFEP